MSLVCYRHKVANWMHNWEITDVCLSICFISMWLYIFLRCLVVRRPWKIAKLIYFCCAWCIKSLWPEPANKLCRPSNRHLSAKLVPTFEDRGCHMVSVTVPYSRILGFLDRSRYIFFQVAPQLYSQGWVVAPGIEPGPLDL
jgi:hypothetical protein